MEVIDALIKMCNCEINHQLNNTFLTAVQSIAQASSVKFYFVESSTYNSLTLKVLDYFEKENQEITNKIPTEIGKKIMTIASKKSTYPFSRIYSYRHNTTHEIWFAWRGITQIKGLLHLHIPLEINNNIDAHLFDLFRGYAELSNRLQNQNSVTKLLNRKMFDSYFAKQLPQKPLPTEGGGRRLPHHGQPCWLVGFRVPLLNEIKKHGDLITENAFLFFSRVLKKHLRETDILFQFGQTEFFALLRAPYAENVISIAKRLEDIVSKLPFLDKGILAFNTGFTKVQEHDHSDAVLSRVFSALANTNYPFGICEYESVLRNSNPSYTTPMSQTELNSFLEQIMAVEQNHEI